MEGQKGWEEGWEEEWKTEGWMDGRKEERKKGRKEGREDGRKEERKKRSKEMKGKGKEMKRRRGGGGEREERRVNHCIKHSGKKCAYPSSNLETIITGPKDSSFAMNISSFTSVNTVGSKKYPIKIVYYDFINTPSSLVAFYQTFLCTLLFCTYSTYLLTCLLTFVHILFIC